MCSGDIHHLVPMESVAFMIRTDKKEHLFAAIMNDDVGILTKSVGTVIFRHAMIFDAWNIYCEYKDKNILLYIRNINGSKLTTAHQRHREVIDTILQVNKDKNIRDEALPLVLEQYLTFPTMMRLFGKIYAISDAIRKFMHFAGMHPEWSMLYLGDRKTINIDSMPLHDGGK